MCGIAVIISGVRINLSSLLPDFLSPCPELQQVDYFSIDELKAALRRRGPDSFGTKKLILHSENEGRVLLSRFHHDEVDTSAQSSSSLTPDYETSLSNQVNRFGVPNSIGELLFFGATLQLRGLNPISQPLVDSFGNLLVFNGEIFGGIHVDCDSNDTEVLMGSLEKCCSCTSLEACHCGGEGNMSVPELLSAIKGPWAVIYWQNNSRTLWFGRDAFGRRSLLVHWPNAFDSRFLLSSVAPTSLMDKNSDLDIRDGMNNLNFWEELSCGIYSITMNAPKADGYLAGEVKRLDWANSTLKELVKWERTLIVPKPEMQVFKEYSLHSNGMLPELGPQQFSASMPAQMVLSALRESMKRRTIVSKRCQQPVPVAVLFSGGLDSMILAALLNESLYPSYEIDLINVSFDNQFAPDRISAKAGVKELSRIAPLRRWNLVEIDASLSELTSEIKRVTSLINPAETYMDLNIGMALWLAAAGDGWLCRECNNDDDDCERIKFKSAARILLVGSGADEQCAGYGRHRTKYREGSWLKLNEEMKLDMHRIWKRNLGRDDRCISDNGKEARFPFLDEDVIRTLLGFPLWEIAELNQPSGTGDKKILREVARLLGLYEAAVQPKRAIQFGSRIARESNRKNFGSNRAANQASAGSVVIHKPST
ncbi:Asparagine synthase [Dillenia turbinata]|uniref:Asparagine synthase n=1 Tax=Dillenia turbinata TaxID=194707 RepID=A0AAN8Z620_9MAGN